LASIRARDILNTPPPARRRDRWITAAAWATILAVVACVAGLAAESGPVNAPAGAATQWELMGRAAVGIHRFLGANDRSSRELVDNLDKGSVELRQRAVVVADEIEGAAAAHARLEAFDVEAKAAEG